MAKGIVRKIDELGRITLPIEVRRMFEISSDDRVGLNLDGQVIRVSKTIVGMNRPLDHLGRIALPIEYRRTLGLKEKDPVDMYIDNGEICIQKVGCEWCGEINDLIKVQDHNLCIACAAAVTAAAVRVLEV